MEASPSSLLREKSTKRKFLLSSEAGILPEIKLVMRQGNTRYSAYKVAK
jgi:hypothetical protein